MLAKLRAAPLHDAISVRRVRCAQHRKPERRCARDAVPETCHPLTTAPSALFRALNGNR